MKGIVVLQGGGPFRLHDDVDRRLLSEVGANKVVVLPTADAFERPEELVDAARAWGGRLGLRIEPVPLAFVPSTSCLIRRHDGWEQVGPCEIVGDLPITAE